MNYSELSDFDINMRVADAVEKSEGREIGPALPDYCNLSSNAWPIIAANKISLTWDEPESEWCAFDSFLFGLGTWDMAKEPEIYYHHANPIRAAMIVYLMMQEQKA